MAMATQNPPQYLNTTYPAKFPLRKIMHKCPNCDGQGNTRKIETPKFKDFAPCSLFIKITRCSLCKGFKKVRDKTAFEWRLANNK